MFRRKLQTKKEIPRLVALLFLSGGLEPANLLGKPITLA